MVDRDGTQRNITTVTLLSGLNTPNGVAYQDGSLWVAQVLNVTRYDNVDAAALAGQVRWPRGLLASSSQEARQCCAQVRLTSFWRTWFADSLQLPFLIHGVPTADTLALCSHLDLEHSYLQCSTPRYEESTCRAHLLLQHLLQLDLCTLPYDGSFAHTSLQLLL